MAIEKTVPRRSRQPRRFERPVYVTRPLLPCKEEYFSELDEIWESGWLTNEGPKHTKLESALGKTLGADYLSLFNNGTLAMVVACHAMRLTGEVITTPFTFPATPHVLSWNGIKPVFADIDPDTLTISPKAIEPLITSKTSGILGVHVYGMPCDVIGIDNLAKTYGLKVIYDGAHAFGTKINDQPIGSFGDATMFSFHATKLFHTIEGGALVVHDEAMKKRVDYLKNFGIKNETEVIMAGINGKMNEFQAAMGLKNLALVSREIENRKIIGNIYREELDGIDGVRCFQIPSNIRNSEQYFIIQVDEIIRPKMRDILYHMLKEFNIITRRYFYPLCSEANCYSSLPSANPLNLPIAHKVSREVLALPYYGSLRPEDAHRITECIRWSLN